MTARVLRLDGRPHHRTINRRPLTDATAMAKPIAAGREALGLIQLISPTRRSTALRGLTLWADRDAIRCALLAVAEHRATLDLWSVDRHDPEQRELAGFIDADAEEIPAVVTGLTPRMGARHRDAAWEQLVDAATRALDLRAHEAAGTTPRYLRCDGVSVQEAMAAEDEDVAGIITDSLAALCVHGHRAPEGPGAA